MDWVRTINAAIDYMEAHLKDAVTLSDIAKHVHLSAFHFQRAFSLLTGMSPAEYLRKRRLSQKELSDLTGIDQSDLSKIERGTANPSVNTLNRIAKALDAKLLISIA